MMGRSASLVVFAFPLLVQALVEQQLVDAALGEDDQCARDDVQCALKALQVKASKEVPEVETAANATDLPWQCTTGIVNRIRNQGPECFNRCPNLCGPVAVAVKRFFRGGSTAVKKSICSMKQEFECAYHDDNAAACEGFLAKARAFRVELPPTVDALTQQCNSLVQVKTTEVAEVKAIAEVETSAEVKSSAEVEVKTAANATDLPWQCTTGIVNRIRNQGPECFNRCPNLCGPVAVAVKRFFR